jgi:hypothetical protein
MHRGAAASALPRFSTTPSLSAPPLLIQEGPARKRRGWLQEGFGRRVVTGPGWSQECFGQELVTMTMRLQFLVWQD